MSYLSQAAALQESGLLVSGMCVTDLSTGFSLTGGPETRAADFLTVADEGTNGDVNFRGTEVKIAKLELLAELVHQVLDQREDNAEWASINPPEPREHFPWGLDLQAPDVLVAGDYAETVASYLRRQGMRARPIDEAHILSVADSLGDAEEELDRLLGGVLEAGELNEGEYSGASDGRGGNGLDLAEESEGNGPGGQRLRMVGIAAAVAVSVLLVFVGVKVFGGREAVPASPDATDALEASETLSISEDQPTTGGDSNHTENTTTGLTVLPPEPGPMEDYHKAGQSPDQPSATGRAAIPVSIDVPGFARSGASQAQEQFTVADDPNFRILVAATPTPLESQEELDDAVLRELALHDGVAVVTTAPVAYREVHPESNTVWHVRLRDGHQVSIGCQSRGAAPEHNAACDKAVDTAHVDSTG